MKIIYYDCDPRFTRRALRCHLRQGGSIVFYHAPVGRCALYGRTYVIPRNPRTPPPLHMNASSAPSPKTGSPASPSPSATPGTSTPAASTPAGVPAAAPSPASKPTSNSTPSWAASDAPHCSGPRPGPPPSPQPSPGIAPPLGRRSRQRQSAPIKSTINNQKSKISLCASSAPGTSPPAPGQVRPPNLGSAPCSPGWTRMRRPVFLGLLPAPINGVSNITPLYLPASPPRPPTNKSSWACLEKTDTEIV